MAVLSSDWFFVYGKSMAIKFVYKKVLVIRPVSRPFSVQNQLWGVVES